MKTIIKDILIESKKINIFLFDIEKKLPSNCEYADYSKEILDLLSEGILEPIKSSGDNGKNPLLANKFRIRKSILTKEFRDELLKFELKYMNIVDLKYYYDKTKSIWRADEEYIIKICDYLTIHGFPKKAASKQERAYELVSDEKWLFTEQGKNIIKRLGILNKLFIVENSEPAMFALNSSFADYDTYRHLIVENKAVYYKLIKLLDKLEFSTLIFGAGWRVISCMKDFDKQFPFNDKKHVFYYFGDLDYEGISIASSLSNIIDLKIARSFYQAYLDKKASNSRTNQRVDENAIEIFLKNFSDDFSTIVIKELENGRYWPQETFNEDELLAAWRSLL